jgi:hypothetical protein
MCDVEHKDSSCEEIVARLVANWAARSSGYCAREWISPLPSPVSSRMLFSIMERIPGGGDSTLMAFTLTIP